MRDKEGGWKEGAGKTGKRTEREILTGKQHAHDRTKRNQHQPRLTHTRRLDRSNSCSPTRHPEKGERREKNYNELGLKVGRDLTTFLKLDRRYCSPK